jgi:hypothetical protein
MIPGFPETYGQGERQFIGHALGLAGRVNKRFPLF